MFLNDYVYSFVCMHLHTWTHLHISFHVCIVCVVCMHVCTCECGYWRSMLGFFNHFPPYILRRGVSLNLELASFPGLNMASKSPGSVCLHLLSTKTVGSHHHAAFYMDVGIKLRPFVLAWQTLYRLSHPPRSHHNCLQGRWL